MEGTQSCSRHDGKHLVIRSAWAWLSIKRIETKKKRNAQQKDLCLDAIINITIKREMWICDIFQICLFLSTLNIYATQSNWTSWFEHNYYCRCHISIRGESLLNEQTKEKRLKLMMMMSSSYSHIHKIHFNSQRVLCMSFWHVPFSFRY